MPTKVAYSYRKSVNLYTVYRVLLLVVHEVQIYGQTQVLATGTMMYVMYSVMSVIHIITQPKLLCSNGGGCTVSHMIAGNRNALIEDNRKVMECYRLC